MFSITIPDITKLPGPLAHALLAEMQRQVQGESGMPISPPPPSGPSVGRPNSRAVMHDDQVRDLWYRCRSESSKALLGAIAQQGTEIIDGAAIQRTLGPLYNDQLWGGLTRATRNVMADARADLVSWVPVPNSPGQFMGKIAPETLAALRRVLAIS
jgi:hypothetical protein